MTKDQIITFNQKNIFIGKSPMGYGFSQFARKDFKKGEEIVKGWGKIIDHQTDKISIQLGMNKHCKPNKWTGRYWNHSCNSNTYVNTRADGFPSLFAAKDIKKGEEITFHYAMTEYEWVTTADEVSVKCSCGSKKCSGRILSFSQLSTKEQKYLKDNKLCSRYLYSV